MRDAEGEWAGMVGGDGVTGEGEVELDRLTERLGEEVLRDGAFVLVWTAFHQFIIHHNPAKRKVKNEKGNRVGYEGVIGRDDEKRDRSFIRWLMMHNSAITDIHKLTKIF